MSGEQNENDKALEERLAKLRVYVQGAEPVPLFEVMWEEDGMFRVKATGEAATRLGDGCFVVVDEEWSKVTADEKGVTLSAMDKDGAA